MSSLLLVVAVLPHVGGVETPTTFVTPAGVGNIVDESAVVSWDDMDDDPTGIFDFYYQPSNNRPGDVDPATFPGLHIFQAMAMDATDQFTWDTSGVPSGSYYLYGVTTDPPLAQIFSFSRGVVTVRHAGDPLHPAVYVPNPDGFQDIVQGSYELTWEASGTGPFTATVAYGDLLAPDDPLVTLVADAPMTDAGGGLFTGSYQWDLTPFTSGRYFYVHVTVTDGAGLTHSAYSRSTLITYYPPDAGPADDDGGGITFPDAGPSGGDDPGCCAVAGRARARTPWGMAGLGLLAVMALRRRSRRSRR